MPHAPITAVLGPTNTGKTFLAVERMCAHSSGMIGFPLRLLAREVYDRVVAIKGPKEVALITGEEKIMPPGARWLLCTAESMPVGRDVAFAALDEAQLGCDAERGHVFTDRLLNVRGREETMILGSESLRPIIRALIPEAEIITRPRFSQLSYAGPKKLSRLPPRSAIVAFSAEEVYAIAEIIRRTRGGAAVVMGALSPRTRNAQVAMYQAGEVDYLVATDAIGMGLNMDVSHIAFASLTKFDGRRQRRLFIPEMAQIAGRAGRHQRDGSFGTLAGTRDAPLFTDHEIEKIEAHQFSPLSHLYWRNGEPEYDSLTALIESLEWPPQHRVLRAAPEAEDLGVLKHLAADPTIIARATYPGAIARLWEACGLPDFRKTGAEYHARLVARIYGYLMSGTGHIPAHVIAEELARLDSVQGDIPTLAARIASARTWAYAAQRADWLDEPAHWAAKTLALEEKLSDALHAKLTERFVDRRTTLLMRGMAADNSLLDVVVAADGTVSVEDEMIGRLDGFRFTPDPAARRENRKRLLAAAEARLPQELARRAAALVAAEDNNFNLLTDAGAPILIVWQGIMVGSLRRGRDWLEPRISVDPAVAQLPPLIRESVQNRLERWLAETVKRKLAPFVTLCGLRDSLETPAAIRALTAEIISAGGITQRTKVDAILAMLDSGARQRLRGCGLVIGSLDLFHPLLLKPEATRWRMALLAVYRGKAMPPLPMAGLGLLDRPTTELAIAAGDAGFHHFGNQMLRVDLVERIARALHDQRKGATAFAPDLQLSTSLGIGEATLARILRALGFINVENAQWRWHGRRKARPEIVAVSTGSAFDALRDWRGGGTG
jgi:ATP-dependent RNA helicase SUPV3L1/SUV3